MSELILIAGGTCSGKTALARKLSDWLGDRAVFCSQDNYYKDHGHLSKQQLEQHNFDDPDEIDDERMFKDVQKMLKNRPVKIPIYNFKTHRREKFAQTVSPAEFIIFEGIFALYYEQLVERALAKIFVYGEENVRMRRRIQRDTAERERTREQALKQYLSTTEPMYKECIEPTMVFADLVVTGVGDAATTLETMQDYLLGKLRLTARAVVS